MGGPRAGSPARGVGPGGRSAGSWGGASRVARRFLGRALMRPNIEPRGNERSNAFLSRVSPRSIPAGGTDLVVFRVMLDVPVFGASRNPPGIVGLALSPP